MEKARFEYSEGSDGRHYWHLRAAGATAENEIIATGEGYSSEQAAREGVTAVQRGVLSALGIDSHQTISVAKTTVSGDGYADPITVSAENLVTYVKVDEAGILPL
jgi:uncharacterized protein YegP (UPF0339 family)